MWNFRRIPIKFTQIIATIITMMMIKFLFGESFLTHSQGFAFGSCAFICIHMTIHRKYIGRCRFFSSFYSLMLLLCAKMSTHKKSHICGYTEHLWILWFARLLQRRKKKNIVTIFKPVFFCTFCWTQRKTIHECVVVCGLYFK